MRAVRRGSVGTPQRRIVRIGRADGQAALRRLGARAWRYGVTSRIIMSPPPPCSSRLSFVAWWLMWQCNSHLPG